MTSKMLLEQYMAERRALGFSLKTDEGCIRRFLQDFVDPDDGDISFTKEYVLSHIGNRRNMQTTSMSMARLVPMALLSTGQRTSIVGTRTAPLVVGRQLK